MESSVTATRLQSGPSRRSWTPDLRVPHDVSVVGAGNVHYSDLLAVPLTTVDQGTCQMGARAAELLMERILLKRSARPKKILISPKLVERESTRR